MGFAAGLNMGFGMTTKIADAFKKAGIDKDVADALATKATESVGGDYQKSMGLDAAPEQAAQLQAQDAAFGKDGAQATADSLNSNTADPTPASAQGLTTKYSLMGTDSNTPFTPSQADTIRMQKVADIYAKNGMLDKAQAIKDKLREQSRQDMQDAQQAEKFAREKKGWAASDATAARENAVRAGVSDAFKTQREAAQGSQDYAKYEGDLAGAVQGKGIDAAIRANAGPDATPDEIDAAIAAYHGSLDDATRSHNAAGMANLYKTQAQVFGEIGGDPAKAQAALKMADAEGVPQLIEALKAGKVDEANQLWNSTGQGRGIVKSVGTDKNTGDLHAIVIDPYSGQRIGPNGYVNVSAMERALMSAQEVAKLNESDSKIAENKAQTASAYAGVDEKRASADKSRAETAQTKEETAYFKEHGHKPSKEGGGYKVEAGEVSNALGSQVTDSRGRPQTDLNGRPLIQRNLPEERAFYKWMNDNGIKDTNEGLAKWQSGAREAAMPKPAAPKPKAAVESMRAKFNY